MPVDAASDLLDRPGGEVDDTQRTMPAFVAGERHPFTSIVECVRPVPHPPGRAGVFDRFAHDRSVADVDVQPTRTVVDVDRLAVRCEPRLLDGAISDPPLGEDARGQVEVDPDRSIPRHVRR